ncbi:MAG: RimK-like ATPgrasp N-terminal domain-containing protein [Planctomycetes bacterium]|nr:RimK-like ATPgrasp N-terminal domain-containing protein [Planctomycetota bacterium]
MERLIAAILLGIVTHDANLLVIETKDPDTRPHDNADRRQQSFALVLEIPDVQGGVRQGLPDRPGIQQLQGIKVFNLCRYYSYQSLAYYVSLLAEARGHRRCPTLQRP